MTKSQKRQLRRVVIAAILFIVGLVFHFWYEDSFPYGHNGLWALFFGTYAVIGYDIVFKALRNIARGQVFDENFLMTIATIGAFFLGQNEEAVGVMLFYQIGEFFQNYAVHKSRRSISDLMNIRPDYANVMRENQLVTVSPEEVRVEETIIVKPGERIPLDGVVLDGYSNVDTSALTGESVPREIQAGDEVISGCINQTGKLTVKVSKEYGQSTVAKILELVENSSSKKSKSEAFITRFARYYTPIVVVAATLLAVLPPLIIGTEFSPWISRALTFLVISCPCALVISVPLSFFGGIGGASKSGVLIKGSNYLEGLADAEVAVFDKTGTLTKGSFAVSDVYPTNMKKEELLELAAHAEGYSNHPIAASIGKAFGSSIKPDRITEVEEIPGHGVKAVIDGKTVLAGNARLMNREKIEIITAVPAGTVVHIAMNGIYEGYILIEDEIKPDSPRAIAELRAAGINKLVMLTGDADAIGKKVAEKLRLDKAYTELLPADKVEKMEELMAEKSAKGKLVFVGDGINDAPVLARADIGIAMGGLGSDAAIEAADVVIMTDEPSKIATAMQISKKTLGIVSQNIVFALAVKGVVLVLGALGYASMWAAVFADVGVSVIAILNAVRALNVKEFERRDVDATEQEYVARPQRNRFGPILSSAAAILAAIAIGVVIVLANARSSDNGEAGEGFWERIVNSPARNVDAHDHSQDGSVNPTSEPDDHDHDRNEDVAVARERPAIVYLIPEQRELIRVDVSEADAGRLEQVIRLSGEVRLNMDRTARLMPHLPGFVTSVQAKEGEKVEKGQPLADITSLKLGEMHATYHAAQEHEQVAQAEYARSKALYERQVVHSQEHERLRKAAAEAVIARRHAESALRSLHIKTLETDASTDEIQAFLEQSVCTRHTIYAPFSGTVISKDITVGDNFGEDSSQILFTVSDLGQLWLDLQAGANDLALLKQGMEVLVETEGNGGTSRGVIEYVAPVITEASRTAIVRVAVDNQDGRLRPGLFATGVIKLAVPDARSMALVPRDAVQIINGERVVFIPKDNGFAPQPVVVDRAEKGFAEIAFGLAPGERYVSAGAFELKSILLTSGMDPHAGHGH